MTTQTNEQQAVALPEPAVKATQGFCCGMPTTGGEYMGQREEICCGQFEEAEPDYYTADQMRSYAQQVREAHTQELVAKAGVMPTTPQADWVKLMNEAQQIVMGKFLWKRFIEHTPLSNDIAVWMMEFARAYVLEEEQRWNEAIAVMQAQYESAKEAAVLLATLTRESADEVFKLRARVAELEDALREIEWSNNSKWQADRARAAMKKGGGV